MHAQQATHPSADTLQAFGLGKLTDSLLVDTVLRHVESCPECREKGTAICGDSFVQGLRRARENSDAPIPTRQLSDIGQVMKSADYALTTQPEVLDLPPELRDHPQYEIQGELGRGGMGVVYLAKNKLMERLEVLKVVNKSMLNRPGALERFLREIRSAAQLNHPNVVSAYNAMQLGELLVFAMEYVPGEDLAHVVRHQGGPLPVVNACYYTQQIVLGLQHAFEKGMVHRDIKPHNLMLARKDKKHVVKILDFGLAKARSEGEVEHGLTGAGQMLGTPDYMAPEQWRDAAHADIRADIYSLGCTLYFLLAGHAPFQGNSLLAIWEAHQNTAAQPLNELRSEVPAELAKVVEKMMAKDPAERYQTPLQVAPALLPFIKGAGQGKSTGQFSAVAAPAPEAKSQPQEMPVVSAEAIRQETLLEGPATIGEARARPTAPIHRATETTPPANKKWLIAVGGLAAMFLLFVVAGLITFAVLRGIGGGGSEDKVSEAQRIEQEKAKAAAERKAKAEQMFEEERKRMEIAKQKESDEKRQKAIEAEQKRREEWEAAQRRADEERRRKEERARAEEEKAKRERAEKERAEAERRKQEAAEAELKRKNDLEKRGLSYYPNPTTAFAGKDAQQWYDYLMSRPKDDKYREQTLKAFEALGAEGMPFLVKLLQDYQKKKLQHPVDQVLRAMKPELIHSNDLRLLLDCLDEECCKDFTRMMALEYLSKRKESKKYIIKIQSLVEDLTKSPKYKDQAKEFMDTLAKKD
jgi:serine/threonine protein kinase